ncbi:MAG: class A beta-lactamase-related serine hydrolase [candidate division KSB1 bacterium]|nr:class A beta-lactamase-related serine hydrolase [candidate division KSB1 bacterium]
MNNFSFGPRLVSLFLLLFTAISVGNRSQAQSLPLFEQQMFALEKSFGGRLGIMAKNLKTGELLSYKATEKFPTASVIKLPIMVEYFYQVAEGNLNPNQRVVLSDSNKWGGSGLLQYFEGTSEQKLIDAVMLMITISDNTATNLVIDALGRSHEEKLAAVNHRMEQLGLKNTRLLNKLMSWATKTNAPESVRYGVGVATPEDMVVLLEKIYAGAIVDSFACRKMIEILAQQFYNDMIPRFLPFETTPDLRVAHKTGSVTGVRCDVGLVLSPRVNFAIAIFCDQIQDRRENEENSGVIAASQAARLVWNHFTGDTGLTRSETFTTDWNPFPGGSWTRIFLRNAPFPHPSRQSGYTYRDQFFPFEPHYSDSSVIVIIPDGYSASTDGNDLVIHFHGWHNDVLQVMEQFNLAQQFIASRKNALLILAQGPYRASDSDGGKMEDNGGLKRLVEEILQRLTTEKQITNPTIGKVILSAHSGGYRPALLSLARGQLDNHITEVWLFDAFYAQTELLVPWLKQNKRNRLRSIYTEHLAPEHEAFIARLKKARLSYATTFAPSSRIVLSPTSVCHDCVMEKWFQTWLAASSLRDRPK